MWSALFFVVGRMLPAARPVGVVGAVLSVLVAVLLLFARDVRSRCRCCGARVLPWNGLVAAGVRLL